MKRRKNEEILENIQEQDLVNDTVEQEVKQEEEQVIEIPESVDKILSIYPNYSELYVTSKGGAFPKDAKPNSEPDAILYQNPYFKS